ncbi:MAG: cadherin-like beta sandwich domain-containing protein [Treponema sp.]|jgi:hypothetical protein|nr:cadherin-like beta sandwich domain-containing protein [Treponema sp.]
MKKFVRNLICGVTLGFFAVSLTTCDMLDYPLDEYHAEQTGTLAVEPVRAVADHVAIGTDGYVCVAPGTQTIIIPLDNPLGYAVREDGLAGFPSGLPAGVTVTAAQSADKNSIEITVNGAAGDEFPISLTVKTAKEGRLLASQTLNVACVNFETRLVETTGLRVSGVAFVFSADLEGYAINDILTSNVVITAVPMNADAVVSIGGGLAVDSGTNTVTLDTGSNTVTVRVTAAHGAASREYKLFLTRNQSSSSNSITAFTLAGVTVTSVDIPSRGVITDIPGPPPTGTISVKVPYGTNLTNLTPTVIHSGRVSNGYSPTGPQNFSNPVTYTVTSEDGTPRTYTVSVNTVSLSSLVLVSPPAKTTYALQTAADTGLVTTGMMITALDANGNSSDVTAGCTASYDFTSPGMKVVTITHTASGKSVAFMASVVGLTNLTVAGCALEPAFSPAITAYTGIVPASLATVDIFAVDTSGAGISIGGDAATPYSASKNKTINPGPNPAITITTSLGGVSKSYTLTITRRPEAPVVSSITHPASQKLTASWGAVTGAATYEIYHNNIMGGGSPPTSGTTPTIQDITGITQDITGLDNGNQYNVRVRAKTSNGVTGVWSAPQSARPGVVTLAELTSAITTGGTVYIAGSETSNNIIELTGTIPISYTSVTLVPVTDVTLKRAAGNTTNSLFSVSTSGTLNLGRSTSMYGTLTIDGGSIWTDNGDGIIAVSEVSGVAAQNSLISVSNGSLFMYDGIILQNNRNNSAVSNGGAVYLMGSTFTMQGGEIQYCGTSQSGGGVYLNAGTFTMSGGRIRYNYATSGGGVYKNSGTFNNNYPAGITNNSPNNY